MQVNLSKHGNWSFKIFMVLLKMKILTNQRPANWVFKILIVLPKLFKMMRGCNNSSLVCLSHSRHSLWFFLCIYSLQGNHNKNAGKSDGNLNSQPYNTKHFVFNFVHLFNLPKRKDGIEGEYQTGNDFRKVMYSIHTGPDAMSAPGTAQMTVFRSSQTQQETP